MCYCLQIGLFFSGFLSKWNKDLLLRTKQRAPITQTYTLFSIKLCIKYIYMQKGQFDKVIYVTNSLCKCVLFYCIVCCFNFGQTPKKVSFYFITGERVATPRYSLFSRYAVTASSMSSLYKYINLRINRIYIAFCVYAYILFMCYIIFLGEHKIVLYLKKKICVI